MRTIVDLPEEDVKALDVWGTELNLSRAELVRQAVKSYIVHKQKKGSDEMINTYFGFLKNSPDAFNGLDAIEYQQKMRGEWQEREDMYGRWGFHENKQSQYHAETSTNKTDQ